MDDNKVTDGRKQAKRRAFFVVQMCLWISLPLLVCLYLLYAVETQSGMLYRLVSGTPIEQQSLRVLPFLWRNKTFLERQAMNSNLTAQERMAGKQLFKRMERIRPTHSVLMKNGSFFFGRPSKKTQETNTYIYYDDNHRLEKAIPTDQIESITPLAMGQREFTPRNIRFILSFPTLNHYYLDPYLLASEVSFSSAMELYGILALFEDQFRSHFGPLIHSSSNQIVQIAYFSSHQSLVRNLDGILTIPDASAFFSKTTNTLYICKIQKSNNPSSAHMFHSVLLDSATDRREKKLALFKVIRHEGAHYLTESMGALEGLDMAPFWIEEGLAQYCETSPFGEPHGDKLLFLRKAERNHKLLEWDTLLEATQEDLSKLPESQQQLHYAQAWILFHYLMEKKRRPLFLSFLLKVRETGRWQASDNLELATTLRTTWSRIHSDILDYLNASSAAEKSVPQG